jgi:GT2 family glycosyltransferase
MEQIGIVMKIAVLVTCYNRKQKTDTCLTSLFESMQNLNHKFDTYLVDDNSQDDTSTLIKEKYPQIHLIEGNGSLYWAGGMRLAWRTALESGEDYDGFLLINDDVVFESFFWGKIEKTMQYCEQVYPRKGIYVSSTKDKYTGQITYGGHKFKKKLFKHSYYNIKPTNEPQECQLTNANILYVSREVVDTIGILDSRFTHALADFDYSLTAWQKGFPILVSPGYGGDCPNDHPEDILSCTIPIRKRIANLYGIKGLSLNEYLYYLRKHFWWKAPYAFFVLWLRAIFPQWIQK